MGPVELERHLSEGNPAPVYLFVGEAELLMEEAWSRLLEKLVPPAARRFNGERLSASEHEAREVVERLNTLSMFGPRQLLMVQHVEAWTKEHMTVLLGYLERPNPRSCLVLTSVQKKGGEKLEAAVRATGKVVVFPPLAEKDAPRWLQERAQKKQKSLAPRAAALLVEQVGLDLRLLDRELDKLASYIGDKARIDEEDVRQVAGTARTFTGFELLRAVGRDRPEKAIAILRSLTLSGEPPLRILALLAREARMLWQIRDGLERGLSSDQINQRLKIPSFAMKNYLQQVKPFSQADLHRIHRMLRETDVALKSTGTAPEVMLEGLVLALCRSTQKTP